MVSLRYFSTPPRKLISLAMAVMLLGQGLAVAPSWARPERLTGDVRVTVSPANLHETIPIRGADRKVTMVFRDMSLQDALRALARQGGFNVLIDDTVNGNISVDLHNVSIQSALDTLKDYGKLVYAVQGNNLMVTHADSDKAQALQKTVTRVIPLHHGNARVLANMLNQTLFSDRIMQAMNGGGAGGGAAGAGGAGGGASGIVPMPVTPDFHTNSLVVVGTPTDIKTVEEHVAALDVPREMKTWRLSQANALDVATILSSSLFNEGQPALLTGGGSGGASGGSGQGGGSQPSSLRVTAENIEEGTGASEASQSGGGASGGSGGSTETAPLVGSMTLRARVKESQTVQISNTGPMIIPDTRLNTITLLGTAEQIAMAEALIPTLDRKIPQVVMEVSLVEVKEDGVKELGYSTAMNRSKFSMGSNNVPNGQSIVNQMFSNLIGRSNDGATPLESVFRYTTDSASRARQFAYQLRGLVNQNKAKILANPTVITTSDNESVISMVDEIVRSVTVTQQFGVPPTATINIGEAGIVLNILPRVGADNTVSMRIRPVVSTILGTRRDRFNNLVTLLSRREVLAQNVLLKDGETFVLGGLVHNTNTAEVGRDPVLSSLPIVGALARNSDQSKSKSELVVMITPHIVNDESQVGRNANVPNSQLVPATLSKRQANPLEPGMVPVSMQGTTRNSALPPLEPAQVLGQGNAPSLRLPDNGTSSVKPSPKPSVQVSGLKAEDMVPAPRTEKEVIPVSTGRIPVTDNAPSKEDISDAKIRAIMEKFK